MYVMICDESYTNDRYLVLGALVFPRRNHAILVDELQEWKKSQGLNPLSEFKWRKVSRKYLSLYSELMGWLFRHVRAEHMRFRSLVLDTGHALYREFSEGNTEKGFYKAYYHLLLQSLKEVCAQTRDDKVLILLDEKRDRYPFHRDVLKKTLNSAVKRDLGIAGLVANIEDRRSSGPKGEPLIQAADILTGAIGFVRNGLNVQSDSSAWKRGLVEVIEREAGTRLSYDTMRGSPFNIWTFDLSVAMERKRRRKAQERKGKRPQA